MQCQANAHKRCLLSTGDADGWSLYAPVNEFDRDFKPRFLLALLWATRALVGHNVHMPITDLQYVYHLCISLFGYNLYALLLARLASLLMVLDAQLTFYRETISDVIDHLNGLRVPASLQNEILSHLKDLWKRSKSFSLNCQDNMLQDLPSDLAFDVECAVNKQMLMSNKFFKTVEAMPEADEFIEALALSLELKVVTAGQAVVVKDDIGSEMFFVSKGQLSVVNELDQPVFMFKAGMFFGELGMMFGDPRTATVKAGTYSQLYTLSREDFEDVGVMFPALFTTILEEGEKARRRFQSSSLSVEPRPDLIQAMSFYQSIHLDPGAPKFVDALASLLQERKFGIGSTIVSKGSKSPGVFFIVEGTAILRQMKTKEVTLLTPNGIYGFGEDEMLRDEPVAWEVYATSDCTTLNLTRASWRLAGLMHPEVLASIETGRLLEGITSVPRAPRGKRRVSTLGFCSNSTTRPFTCNV
eukprot:NODE_47_length_3790_cov_35.743114_g45_i0.p1 GENE.NODE_47_length_3790_cov_35.743114_g45_i0~~NODE_47_length_3790_cov_35.743114_g45_i0.p1  ORF type:complete len:471 (+),score=54.82 NODE_47_length_3790_cov_35.743114_g45_i0:1870-3282(+)